MTQGDDNINFKAETPFFIFQKSLKEFNSDREETDILISQKYVDPSNVYDYNEKTKRRTIKQVTEFLPRKVYMGRVAITNSGESEWDLQVIAEIPKGAIPVNV